MPHALATAELIRRYDFQTEEAGTLLNMTGCYLHERAQYAKAEPLFQRALQIREKALGPEHPDVANSLNNLAMLYHNQGRYTKVEPLYQRALQIREKALGPDHPDVANSLNSLADRASLRQAEPLFQRSLQIWEKAGPDHPDVATSLDNLAGLYRAQGRYAKAEPLYLRALQILEKALGSDHFQRSLQIWEKAPEPEHPHVATVLENYGRLLDSTGRSAEAQALLDRAASIRTKARLE